MKRTVFLMLAFVLAFSGAALAQDLGVYVKVAEKVQGPFDQAVQGAEDALAGAGWNVLASYDSGVDEECGMRAHVIVIHNPDYAAEIMSAGPDAAFALPLRVGVYEDEGGINVAFSNPASINRTVLGDDVKRQFSEDAMKELVGIIARPFGGSAVNEQIGQIRDKGRVGGMGGGDFKDKVEEIHSGGDLGEVAAKVKEGIEGNDMGWRLVYSLELDGTVIYGVTRAKTEARAFGIAGERREKKDYRCPGLDHAAAFPIEVVVYQKDGAARVVTLDEMYRMKLYFEDAGNWAFMKNMTMPGAIEDDIKDISAAKLK